MQKFTPIHIVLVALLFLAACQSEMGSNSQSSQLPLLAYCSTQFNYSGDAVTISGSAKYQYRVNGNGSIDTAGLPIRFAEVAVFNSSGEIIQCAETDQDGSYSVVIPKNNSNTTIAISTKGDGQKLRAYVMNSPFENKPYSLTATFIADSGKTLPEMVALASNSSNLLGGAFHIFDQILNANQFLTAQTVGCNLISGSCIPFQVSRTITTRIYWQKGVNPALEFFNMPREVSFYVPGTQELYILGGSGTSHQPGDVGVDDTDHFDTSIILHEYGHYVEDLFMKADSPGGPHDASSIIDPRLAWSEGFANYFQAAVSGRAQYLDTEGNSDGIPRTIFNLSTESRLGVKEPTTIISDVPAAQGEGSFHEFSITRLLYGTLSSSTIPGGRPSNFKDFWAASTDSNQGFSSLNRLFRSGNLFLELLPPATLSAWANFTSNELQDIHRKSYGSPLLNSSCQITLADADKYDVNKPDDLYHGTPSIQFYNSNLFASNDFYEYNHPGGPITLQMQFTTGTTRPADLDLYLWKDKYVYGDVTTLAGASETHHSPNVGHKETISLTKLPAGRYMINVKLYTGQGSGKTLGGPLVDPAQYTLEMSNANGTNPLCPQYR